MKLSMIFYSSELIYYAAVLNYFTVYEMTHFNYKLHVVIQILRMKVIWRSSGYSNTGIITLTKRQQLVWSSHEDSLKTAKLPILTNSPGHKHNMALNFLPILSSVLKLIITGPTA